MNNLVVDMRGKEAEEEETVVAYIQKELAGYNSSGISPRQIFLLVVSQPRCKTFISCGLFSGFHSPATDRFVVLLVLSL